MDKETQVMSYERKIKECKEKVAEAFENEEIYSCWIAERDVANYEEMLRQVLDK